MKTVLFATLFILLPTSTAFADFYVLGDKLELVGSVPERLMDERYQIPIHIKISNDLHEWNVAITPDGELNYYNSLSLTNEVGFTDGKYTINTTYGDLVNSTSSFTIGEKYYNWSGVEIIRQPDEIKQNCIFTANIEKTWITFGEKPKVWGTVYDCDSNEIHEKNRVFVKILDINGDVVQDSWQSDKKTAKTSKPSLYEFNQDVYRERGFRGNANVQGVEVIHIQPNEYFFYMPQINSLDFDHRGIYAIELTYGNYVRYVSFATLSPTLFWNLDEIPEKDICDDYREKLIRLDNTLKAFEKELVRLELRGLAEKYLNQVDVIKSQEDKIDALGQC